MFGEVFLVSFGVNDVTNVWIIEINNFDIR